MQLGLISVPTCPRSKHYARYSTQQLVTDSFNSSRLVINAQIDVTAVAYTAARVAGSASRVRDSNDEEQTC
ncbi:hypothetical protein EVAR_34111_1 [Eumeta japonica]|uniref:Uncharacterized protein n=1 Tax=Eumeta variegata TaxID=151549 RepID=A0A4C1WMG5_EUMVA|nr:hypothetical protein EVAR_34111_1 [Eumeta japonica]